MANNLVAIKQLVDKEAVKKKFSDLLGNESNTFLASVIDLVSSSSDLSMCDPTAVMAEAVKAAALRLPISKGLGFAYIVPYKEKGVPKPQFQLGYRGLIQLAERSGQYKFLNADVVCEGETVKTDRLSGMLEISGAKTSDKVVGYFGYFKLMNGYEKCLYMTKEQVEAHARKFSKSFNSSSSPWSTNFDAMALKTVLKQLLSKYGTLSIEMQSTVSADDYAADTVEAEIVEHANSEPLTIEAVPADQISDNGITADKIAPGQQSELNTAGGEAPF